MKTLHGLDLSSYQCLYYSGKWHYPNFTTPATQGVTWIKIRLSVGDYYIDPCFKALYEGYKATGLYPDGVAPYIVWTPNRYEGGALIPGKDQVDHAIDAFTKMGFLIDGLPWTGDYEVNRGATRAQISPRITDHLNRMKERYLTGVVYTRGNWWDTYTLRGTGNGYNLHAAHYTGDYMIPPILPADWKSQKLYQLEYQYSADGNLEGKKYGVLSKSVDKDVRFVYDGTTPPPPQTSIQAKALGTLHIRTGPGTQYPSVGFLSNGDVVTVTERKITGEWAKHSRGWSIWQNESGQWMEEV
jgi:hypothetical protein